MSDQNRGKADCKELRRWIRDVYVPWYSAQTGATTADSGGNSPPPPPPGHNPNEPDG